MTVFVINSESMGNGDEALGKILVGAFLKKVWAKNEKPEAILFYNSGVKLLHKEAGLMETMVGLEEAGVDLVACGTCLNHYEMKDAVVAGRVSGMEEIVATMMKADKTITI